MIDHLITVPENTCTITTGRLMSMVRNEERTAMTEQYISRQIKRNMEKYPDSPTMWEVGIDLDTITFMLFGKSVAQMGKTAMYEEEIPF